MTVAAQIETIPTDSPEQIEQNQQKLWVQILTNLASYLSSHYAAEAAQVLEAEELKAAQEQTQLTIEQLEEQIVEAIRRIIYPETIQTELDVVRESFLTPLKQILVEQRGKGLSYLIHLFHPLVKTNSGLELKVSFVEELRDRYQRQYSKILQSLCFVETSFLEKDNTDNRKEFKILFYKYLLQTSFRKFVSEYIKSPLKYLDPIYNAEFLPQEEANYEQENPESTQPQTSQQVAGRESLTATKHSISELLKYLRTKINLWENKDNYRVTLEIEKKAEGQNLAILLSEIVISIHNRQLGAGETAEIKEIRLIKAHTGFSGITVVVKVEREDQPDKPLFLELQLNTTQFLEVKHEEHKTEYTLKKKILAAFMNTNEHYFSNLTKHLVDNSEDAKKLFAVMGKEAPDDLGNFFANQKEDLAIDLITWLYTDDLENVNLAQEVKTLLEQLQQIPFSGNNSEEEITCCQAYIESTIRGQAMFAGVADFALVKDWDQIRDLIEKTNQKLTNNELNIKIKSPEVGKNDERPEYFVCRAEVK